MFSVWKVNCLQVIIVIFIITIIILLLLLFYSRWLYSQGSLKINVKIKYGLDTNPLIRLVEKKTVVQKNSIKVLNIVVVVIIIVIIIIIIVPNSAKPMRLRIIVVVVVTTWYNN